MTGVIGGTVVATGLVTALAVAGESAAVWALAAFGMLGASMALTKLRRRRPRWTDAELDALDDKASLEQLLGRIAQAPEEGKFR